MLRRPPRREPRRREKQDPLPTFRRRDRKRPHDGRREPPDDLEARRQARVVERLGHDETRVDVDQAEAARVALRQRLQEQRLHVHDVRPHVGEAVVLRVPQREVFWEELAFLARGVDRDYVRGESGCEEQGEQFGGESHARVIQERHDRVEAFFRFYAVFFSQVGCQTRYYLDCVAGGEGRRYGWNRKEIDGYIYLFVGQRSNMPDS